MPAATTTIRVSGFGSCTSSSCFHMFWIIARYGDTFLHPHYNAASGTPKPSGGIFLRSSWGGLQSALVPNGNPGGIKLYRSRRRPAMKNAHAIQPDISATSPQCSFLRQAPPHVVAAEEHDDQADRYRIHRPSPDARQNPIALVTGIARTHHGEGVQDARNAPGVDIDSLHRCLSAVQVCLDVDGVAGPAGAKVETARIGAGGGPFDLTRHAQLLENVPCLVKVGARGGPRDLQLEGRLLSCWPELGERPIRVIQKQARKRKQPDEPEQEEADVVVKAAIPELECVRHAAGWSLCRTVAKRQGHTPLRRTRAPPRPAARYRCVARTAARSTDKSRSR